MNNTFIRVRLHDNAVKMIPFTRIREKRLKTLYIYACQVSSCHGDGEISWTNGVIAFIHL